MRFSGILALVVMVAGLFTVGVAAMDIQQVNATLYINRPPIDLRQFTNNNSTIITEPGQGDFNVILPPIENTINCALPSSHPYRGIGSDCVGTDRNDKMTGRSQRDSMLAGPGDDYLLGGNGPDALSGGAGNDLIYTEQGGYYIAGNEGEDRMFGGPGVDVIYAGQLNFSRTNETEWPSYKDFVDCGEGDDKIYVDNLDVYQNCEVVNGQRLVDIDPNRDISNLTRFPENNTMDTNRDISNLTRFP